MSERKRQHLANIALRSPNANERENARLRFLELDDSSRPLLSNLEGASDPRSELVSKVSASFVRSLISETISLKSKLEDTEKDLQNSKKELQVYKKEQRKPALRLILFIGMSIISSTAWGWGFFLTIISSMIITLFAAKKFNF